MNEETDKIRIDKWLWAVRIFKTRNMAAEACKNNKISIRDNPVKPSHVVKIGEEIVYKGQYVSRSYLVKGLIEKRVSAKLAAENVEETTPPQELDKLKNIHLEFTGFRPRGMGRPSKKDRRDIDKLKKNY